MTQPNQLWSSLIVASQPAQLIPSFSRKAAYSAIPASPVPSRAESVSNLSGRPLAIHPAPYGSRLTPPGSATAASLIPMISPATGHGTGPTHLELSTVATLLPASTLRPTFFGLTEMMPLARFWATSVSPTVTTPSSWRAPTCFSAPQHRSSGGAHLLVLATI